MKHLLIVYASQTGHALRMALAAYSGAAGAGRRSRNLL